LEADLIRTYTCLCRRDGHYFANQIMSEQVHIELGRDVA
jgi:hypothetical protein